MTWSSHCRHHHHVASGCHFQARAIEAPGDCALEASPQPVQGATSWDDNVRGAVEILASQKTAKAAAIVCPVRVVDDLPGAQCVCAGARLASEAAVADDSSGKRAARTSGNHDGAQGV